MSAEQITRRRAKNPQNSSRTSKNIWRDVVQNWQLYALLLPSIAMVFIFCYLPLYGIQIAFKNFRATDGIWGSVWLGIDHFKAFFNSYYFERLLSNTFLLNIYGLLWGFPLPILMAILLNQFRAGRYKQFVQTAIYVPHFISPVVMAGVLFLFLNPGSGMVNTLITSLGGKPISFMMESSWFRTLFIGTDIWQHAGWNTILYIATLTGIDPGLYEAATIDGANKRQKIWHIDMPHLVPIIIMVLILNCGTLLASNTDKAFLFQTTGNVSVSDIIGVYVYKLGFASPSPQYSYGAAIGLTINVINFAVIMTVNWFSRKFSETSLF